MFEIPSSGKLLHEFEIMRIKHPRLDEMRVVLDALRESKRRSPRTKKKFASVFAPTYSGKTTSVEMYIDQVVVDEIIRRDPAMAQISREKIAESQRVVVYVELTSPATVKSMAVDILNAFQDPLAETGTTAQMQRRIRELMRHFGTELLVVDEIQHLSAGADKLPDGSFERRRLPRSTAVPDALKSMLNKGVVPMLLMGVESGRQQIFNHPELRSRSYAEIDFSPLQVTSQKDIKIFLDFCGRVCAKLVEHGIVESSINLVKGVVPACVHEVSGGRIGDVMNLIQQACTIAVHANSPELTYAHLEAAVDQWAIPLKLVKRNRFRIERLKEEQRSMEVVAA